MQKVVVRLLYCEQKTFGNALYNIYTGHTQNNGAVLIVNTIKTALFFCVCPVYILVVLFYLLQISRFSVEVCNFF